MSGSVVKAERRKLRRVFGETACDTITAHGRALEHLSHQLHLLQRQTETTLPKLQSAIVKLEGQQVESHTYETNTRSAIEHISRQHGCFKQRMESMVARLQAQQAHSHTHETRPFWQRLRWLLTGR